MKNTGFIILVLSVLAAIGWTVSTPDALQIDPPVEKLTLTGSSTIAPLAAEIGKRFESLHPGARIDVQSGGSSRGIGDVRTGLAHIGLVSRALKAEESDLHAHTIALDGIALIINQSNPIPKLDRKQIVEIFTGKINNWRDVGGTDAPITVVNKAEGRSTLELFLQFFGLQGTDVKPHVIIGDNQQGIKTVAGNANAIGYVSIGSAAYEAEHGAPIKLLPLDDAEATIDNVRNGLFPLSRPLNLVTHGKPSGLAESFIEFAQSDQVHDLIEAQYFVPIFR
ncbi:MAG: ABC transporter substrate-binding protein [Gammaproteobacteria bacterium HGW-Gammaproteobacteria-10]|nr:MAG: ABC transporter substrate-binding protein [Gammaproteobacteria bacterium HGW-Gammaproteobacteria-10]